VSSGDFIECPGEMGSFQPQENLSMNNTGSHTIVERENAEEFEVCPGVWRKTLVHSENLMLVLFQWRKDVSLPLHSHPHRQAGYIISGAIELTVGDEKYIAREGCSYIVSGNEPHCARALEDTVLIDVFTPRREDYLP
jgi:quercetin dioxygenase-like cupin family protein